MSNPPPPVAMIEKGVIRKYGETASKTPQIDWQVTDDGRGLLTGTMKYFYEVSTGKPMGSDFVLTLPRRGERHPFDERLSCKDCSLTVGQNDIGYCDANYVGLNLDPTDAEWSISCPTEEDPIQVHPMFPLKADKQGSFGIVIEEGVAPLYQPKYDPKMVVLGGKSFTEFDKFKVSPEIIAKDLVGVTSYKVPRQTMSLTFHTANKVILNMYMNGVGKQYRKVALAPDIATVAGRSWLFTSLSVTEFAGIYKLDCEYTLSGVGSDGNGKPWNELIYADGDAS